MRGTTKVNRLSRGVLLLVGLLYILACDNTEIPHVSVLPTVEGAELYFRGFVTDEEEELVSQIHNFSMKITRKDTIDGRPVFVYNRDQKQSYFYTDENGTVWEFNDTDIGKQIVGYGFAYREPIVLRKWEILLKVDNGVGTEWSARVDTTFEAITLDGSTQRLHYLKDAKARFEGWQEVFVPEPYANVRVLDAHWYELNTYILNETTGDTLFATEGNAHHYFEPKLGAIKYITDFVKKEKDQPVLALRGTWELMRKEIPE
jgi:hypothetical protein